ncbi:MAG TPA: hypothetical protein VGY76_14605 [Solirubrobacteraceae bacterium]|nr:hypothetical protein [Solirubrobacteraceae bacterium]
MRRTTHAHRTALDSHRQRADRCARAHRLRRLELDDAVIVIVIVDHGGERDADVLDGQRNHDGHDQQQHNYHHNKL